MLDDGNGDDDASFPSFPWLSSLPLSAAAAAAACSSRRMTGGRGRSRTLSELVDADKGMGDAVVVVGKEDDMRGQLLNVGGGGGVADS